MIGLKNSCPESFRLTLNSSDRLLSIFWTCGTHFHRPFHRQRNKPVSGGTLKVSPERKSERKVQSEIRSWHEIRSFSFNHRKRTDYFQNLFEGVRGHGKLLKCLLNCVGISASTRVRLLEMKTLFKSRWNKLLYISQWVCTSSSHHIIITLKCRTTYRTVACGVY